MVNKNKICQKTPLYDGHPGFRSIISTYIASRTVGVPIVGVELYIGKLDMISKIMQIMVISLSVVAMYNIKRPVLILPNNL